VTRQGFNVILSYNGNILPEYAPQMKLSVWCSVSCHCFLLKGITANCTT